MSDLVAEIVKQFAKDFVKDHVIPNAITDFEAHKKKKCYQKKKAHSSADPSSVQTIQALSHGMSKKARSKSRRDSTIEKEDANVGRSGHLKPNLTQGLQDLKVKPLLKEGVTDATKGKKSHKKIKESAQAFKDCQEKRFLESSQNFQIIDGNNAQVCAVRRQTFTNYKYDIAKRTWKISEVTLSANHFEAHKKKKCYQKKKAHSSADPSSVQAIQAPSQEISKEAGSKSCRDITIEKEEAIVGCSAHLKPTLTQGLQDLKVKSLLKEGVTAATKGKKSHKKIRENAQCFKDCQEKRCLESSQNFQIIDGNSVQVCAVRPRTFTNYKYDIAKRTWKICEIALSANQSGSELESTRKLQEIAVPQIQEEDSIEAGVYSSTNLSQKISEKKKKKSAPEKERAASA